jgi:tetratricopeptide (TPR) repeat protein
VNAPSPEPSSPPSPAGRPVFVADGLLVLAGLAVYANSFSGPFVFDDTYSIPLNGTIRRLATALAPPGNGTTVSGRPLLNFSFALNYAISGLNVWSYHALNLLIHVLAGLTLFGIVRRTLALPIVANHCRSLLAGDPLRATSGAKPAEGESRASSLLQSQALPLAFAVALLWTLHPLQTESVTYIVQRSESLMGLFYWLTLYCFIRGATSARAGAWIALSLLACLAGMATKEVMVSAPVMVLLYDRTFLAGSFREAWRRRGRWYLGLAATWLLLGWLVVGAANRGGTAGFGVGVGFWQYAATQFEAVACYLWLALWPHPLIVDYGARWVSSISDVVPYAMVVAMVVAGTAVALWRRPALGFCGAWFLAILAPTSLVPGIRQTIVEHRMYLALAPVIVLLVLGLNALLRRRVWVLLLVIAVGWGSITVQRNCDYRSDLVLWRDTVARHPGNSGPHLSLGDALFERGQPAAALAQFEEALRLSPGDADAYYNAANALVRLGRMDEAIGHYQAALQLRPDYFDAHTNLGETFLRTGRFPEAVKQYEAAVLLEPELPEAYYNLGNALDRAGRLPAAIRELEWAVRLRPDYSEAHNNLGNLFTRGGNVAAAVAQYEAAVRADPANVEAHSNFGTALWKMQRLPEAAKQFERVLRLQPDSAEAAQNLGTIYLHLNRLAEAETQFERVLRLQPVNAAAHRDLGIILGRSGRYQEAAGHLQAALQTDPNDALARYNLGSALLALGRLEEARAEFEAALRLQPGFAPAQQELARVKALQAAGP